MVKPDNNLRADVALPPVPEPQGYIEKTLANGEIVDIAAVSQYRAVEYARAAVLADRQQRGVDAALVKAWQSKNGIDLPAGTREAAMVVVRHDADGKPTVWCDPEIADLVDALNNAKLGTIASCSGHGERPGCITLRDGRELIVLPDHASARAAEKLLNAKSSQQDKETRP